MKKIAFMSFIIFVSFHLSFAEDYQLILDTDFKIIQINDTMTLKLIIKGQNLKNIYGELQKSSSENDNEFINVINIIPVKIGEMIIGPYTLSFQDNILTSNSLKIMIVKQSEDRIFIKADKNEVKLNDEVKIILTGINKKLDKTSIKSTFQYSGKDSSNSVASSFENSKMNVSYQKEFIIKPLKKEKILINKDSFINLDYDISEIEITVK
jgi:hypothetical protein